MGIKIWDAKDRIKHDRSVWSLAWTFDEKKLIAAGSTGQTMPRLGYSTLPHGSRSRKIGHGKGRPFYPLDGRLRHVATTCDAWRHIPHHLADRFSGSDPAQRYFRPTTPPPDAHLRISIPYPSSKFHVLTLEDTCKHYLIALRGLRDDEEHAVQAFSDGEGPALTERLNA
jgi:hypothetical protein